MWTRTSPVLVVIAAEQQRAAEQGTSQLMMASRRSGKSQRSLAASHGELGEEARMAQKDEQLATEVELKKLDEQIVSLRRKHDQLHEKNVKKRTELDTLADQLQDLHKTRFTPSETPQAKLAAMEAKLGECAARYDDEHRLRMSYQQVRRPCAQAHLWGSTGRGGALGVAGRWACPLSPSPATALPSPTRPPRRFVPSTPPSPPLLPLPPLPLAPQPQQSIGRPTRACGGGVRAWQVIARLKKEQLEWPADVKSLEGLLQQKEADYEQVTPTAHSHRPPSALRRPQPQAALSFLCA